MLISNSWFFSYNYQQPAQLRIHICQFLLNIDNILCSVGIKASLFIATSTLWHEQDHKNNVLKGFPCNIIFLLWLNKYVHTSHTSLSTFTVLCNNIGRIHHDRMQHHHAVWTCDILQHVLTVICLLHLYLQNSCFLKILICKDTF